MPRIPDAQRARGELRLRYEDVVQDGRLAVAALSHALGEVLWREKLEAHEGAAALREQGVVPILTRMVFEGGEGPLSVTAPLDVEASFAMAHARGANGEVERIYLNMWVTATGVRGRLHGPPPERAGEPVHAGRMFAEHVFTRLFAAPEERKVVRLDAPGLLAVPEATHDVVKPANVARLPHGATALGEYSPTSESFRFGLAHTDSNLHVNSLVYPRIFEDAALQRFGALGERTEVLMRNLEVAYRKPCFAGDSVRLVLGAFRHDGELGAYGAFVNDADLEPDATYMNLVPRAHAFLRATFAG